MKFQIGLIQQAHEEATVTVEADTREEAYDKAMKLVEEGKVEWNFLETVEQSVDIVSSMVVG